MANINKELNQIKNAIYGKEVRGSIHDGIKKINDESVESKQKANEAHDVMESIMEEGFDSAALESNFEQKLDDKIENLQPEWTQFKEQTNQQLAQEEKQRHYESLVNRKEPGLLISWIDDDGFIEVYDRMLPLMEEYGIPLSSAVITSRVGTDDSKYLNIQQIKELQSKGMEFLSHTHLHDPSYRPIEMTEEELDEDFRESKNFMKDNGLNYHGLVLPFAQTNETVRKVSKRYFDFVFGGKFQRTNPNYAGKIDNYTIDRVSVDTDLSRAKEAIDEAVSNGGGWVVLISHIYNEVFEDDNHAREIIDYSLNKGMEWVKPTEGFNRMGNIAQFDDTNTSLGTTIGADGSINSDKLARMQYKSYQDIGFESPITDFEIDTHTITEINTPNATAFPRGAAGDLNTKRYESSGAYSYQEYVTSRELLRFMRSWDITENKWRDFEQTDVMRYLNVNSLATDENPLGLSVRYTISCCHINAAASVGFPENRSGMYIINALRTSGDSPNREYHIYQSDRVYKSYWKSSSSEWSEWKLQPNFLGEKRRIDQSFSVGAGNTHKIYIESSEIKTNQIFSVSLNKPLPPGIVMDHYISQDGRIEVGFHNIKDVTISVNNLDVVANIINV